MDGKAIRLILAGNIKMYRGRRNWSQADLAEKSGLSVVYLSDIERGNKWPYLDTLVKLSEALTVEIFEFLKPPAPPTGEAASLLTKFSGETEAIFEKSVEAMKKNVLQSFTALRDLYVK